MNTIQYVFFLDYLGFLAFTNALLQTKSTMYQLSSI